MRSLRSVNRYRLLWRSACRLACGLLKLIFVNAAFSQTFLTENALRHPVKLPAGIVKLLEKSEEVSNCLKNYEQTDEYRASWFRAVKVDLTGGGSIDYLVKSHKECLYGPRAATFWIFRADSRGFRQVFTDSVIDLTIQRRKTRGFRDMETDTTMVNIIRNTWKYNGRVYKLVHTRIIEPK